MNYITYLIFVVICLAIICLAVIIYNTYLYKNELEAYHNFRTDNKEEFVNYTSDNIEICKYKQDTPFSFYGYIKHKPYDILPELQLLFYVNYIRFYSINSNDIMQNVTNDIEKTIIKMNGQVLKGPVYYLIYQNNNCNIVQDINNIGTNELLTHLYIIYPNYYHNVDNREKLSVYDDESGILDFTRYFQANMLNDKELPNDYGMMFTIQKNHPIFRQF